MYCKNCGSQIDDKAAICVHCGVSVQPMNAPAEGVDPNDAPSTGFAILGFFIPLVGLILYLMWKNTSPQKAKSAGKGALIGFIVSVVLSVVYAIIAGVAIGSAVSYYY